MVRRPAGWSVSVAALVFLSGCSGVGPRQLDTDQMNYASALGEGLKRQMLLNMVRLRYADVPTFLTVSQVISGYTLQSTGQVGLNAHPIARSGDYATLSGSLQYTTRPTFTFTPLTGERLAGSYLRPLAPAELLSLAQSGAPVDLLFRLGVQSVNGLPNRATISGQARRTSDGFETLLQALHEVQAVGSVSLRFERTAKESRVYVVLDDGEGRAAEALRQARRILGVGLTVREFEVIYGRVPTRPGQVAVLTRSILQILFELGTQVDVSPADVQRGDTPATASELTLARERLLTVRQGERAPDDAYASVQYRGRWFWIDAGDYPSKAAFTFVYVLQVLAESGHGQTNPVVTIPAQ